MTFSNLVLTSRGFTIRTDSGFQEIDRNNDILLKSDKVLINVLRIDSKAQVKSGHYEGVSKLVTPGDNPQSGNSELFSFFGSIDYSGQLLLFPKTSVASFDYIKGQYNEQNEFTGQAMLKGTKVSDISNQIVNFKLEGDKLEDVFFLTINEAPKQVFLTIQKVAL